ncbi:arginine--tRNA ligase [Candidatus Woesearchaeota archaeon]|jgi:arginyl-tRNA synthetase|nr:arginine--tRNA ligase [Candidatus Woesearchaeota archaeon]MBT6044848.1 arginine--tRNA ligase [Candidatus Woesearchaeota archaeon]
MDFKSEVASLISKELGCKKEEVIDVLEIPPESKFGDYSFPCFKFAAKLKKKPIDLAKDLSSNLKGKFIEKVEIKGPYLNIFLKSEIVTKEFLSEIFVKKKEYGMSTKGKDKIMIEFPAPNTNKPLHLGHLRNMFLGQAVSNIFSFLGHKVVPVNLNNDRGVHICKSMWAYEKFGKGKNPDKKSDHFVGDFYVMYNKHANDKSEREIQEMLKKWEDGDKEVRGLWKKMNKWAFEGFDETYKRLGIKFSKVYNESEFYDEGKSVVLDGLKKKLFYKNEDGAVEVDLEKDGLGKKVLLRPDGTSIYITQDLYLAKKKFDDYKIDRSVHVVGSEQDYHFKVLFKLLKILKVPYAEKCFHLSYGMVSLPEGKMKSREGTVVDADDLLDKVEDLSKKEIEKRHKISSKEIKERSEKIGQGALRFFLLKYDPTKDIKYDPKESLSFEGETGPYVQYVHARCCSLLRKSEVKVTKGVDFSAINSDEELLLIKQLGKFSHVLDQAAKKYKPSILARYLLDLSSLFNTFYAKHKIIGDKNEAERMLIVDSVRNVLDVGLSLLSIKAPEEM